MTVREFIEEMNKPEYQDAVIQKGIPSVSTDDKVGHWSGEKVKWVYGISDKPETPIHTVMLI